MKKILNKSPIISICLVFCLTLLLGVFLTLPQSKDVYADTINWTQKAPGLYDDYGNFVIIGEDDDGDILASWSNLKEIYSISSGTFYCDASGNLVIGDNCCYYFNSDPDYFLKTITFLSSYNTSGFTDMSGMFSGDFNTIDIRHFNFSSIDDNYDSCRLFGVLSDDDLENCFNLLYDDIGDAYYAYFEEDSSRQGFKGTNMSYKEKIAWIVNFIVEYTTYLEGYDDELAGWDSSWNLDQMMKYLTDNVGDDAAWITQGGDGRATNFVKVQTIIAPTTVPTNKILLPEPYYFATFDSQGNLTYKPGTYNVMESYTLQSGEVGCAYLLNRAQTNIYGYGSSGNRNVAVIGEANTISSTTTNLTVASARTASGNNQAQAVVANVLDVTGTSGQPVTLKIYCEQNPTTNNQIILMRHNGSSWTQASCNASYDSTNKVLTVTSTMPANSSSFAVLSAPQGDSPAPSPTPGTGIVTNLTLGFVISGVLAGIVATFAITNKKKKYNNK